MCVGWQAYGDCGWDGTDVGGGHAGWQAYVYGGLSGEGMWECLCGRQACVGACMCLWGACMHVGGMHLAGVEPYHPVGII